MKKTYVNLLYVLVILAISLVFSACSNSDTNTISTETNEDFVIEESGFYPFTITDARDVEVTLIEEPNSVISLSPNITEMIYALNAGDKVIGRTDFCDYPVEVQNIQSIGSIITTPDIEKIVELNPDVVIASTHVSKETTDMLRELGLTVISLYAEENFEDTYSIIRDVGLILNRELEATQIIESMSATVNEVIDRVHNLERPSVYYVVDFGEFGDFTAGGNTFIGRMIEMAGGNNIANNVDGWVFNLESLIESDPDIIIVSKHNNTKELFINSNEYSNLTAVLEGNVFEIDNDMLDRQGVRNAEGLKALAKILHPQAFE